MTYEEIMLKLEELGSPTNQESFSKSWGEGTLLWSENRRLKEFVSTGKKIHELALELYDLGMHDAMYLAGLSINPKLISKETVTKLG